MQGQERLRKALDEAAEIKPDVELGKFIRYISSFTNLAYMTDDDLADQIEAYN